MPTDATTTSDGAPATGTTPVASVGPSPGILATAGAARPHATRAEGRANGPEPVVAKLIASNQDCADAVHFKNTFEPQDGVDYGWVGEYAKAQYAHYAAIFKDLDDKANSIVGYLGGGTSLLTLGTLTAVASGQISPWIIVFALPSIGLALASLFFAALARQANWIVSLPTVQAACCYSEYAKFAGKGQAAFLGQWHLCITLMRPVVARKAFQVNVATWLFFSTVATLSLPLIVVLVRRWMGSS